MPAPSGSQIYAANCGLCHGPSGEGGYGPALQESTLSLEEIITVVTNGRAGMPAFGTELTNEEIEAVAAFAKSLQTP